MLLKSPGGISDKEPRVRIDYGLSEIPLPRRGYGAGIATGGLGKAEEMRKRHHEIGGFIQRSCSIASVQSPILLLDFIYAVILLELAENGRASF